MFLKSKNNKTKIYCKNNIFDNIILNISKEDCNNIINVLINNINITNNIVINKNE
jgi:hypothetical protein